MKLFFNVVGVRPLSKKCPHVGGVGVVRITSKVVRLFSRKYHKNGQLPSRINFAILAKCSTKSDFYGTFLHNFHFWRKNFAKTTFYISKNADNFRSCSRAQSRGQLPSGGQLPPRLRDIFYKQVFFSTSQQLWKMKNSNFDQFSESFAKKLILNFFSP